MNLILDYTGSECHDSESEMDLTRPVLNMNFSEMISFQFKKNNKGSKNNRQKYLIKERWISRPRKTMQTSLGRRKNIYRKYLINSRGGWGYMGHFSFFPSYLPKHMCL